MLFQLIRNYRNTKELILYKKDNDIIVETEILKETNEVETHNTIAVDFDSLYTVIDFGDITTHIDAQAHIDAGGIARAYGDYYHHDTQDFEPLIKSLNPGDGIKLNGIIYVVDYQEYGNGVHTGEYAGNIYGVDTGTKVQYDDIIQIIICEDDDSGYNRYLTAIHEE